MPVPKMYTAACHLVSHGSCSRLGSRAPKSSQPPECQLCICRRRWPLAALSRREMLLASWSGLGFAFSARPARGLEPERPLGLGSSTDLVQTGTRLESVSVHKCLEDRSSVVCESSTRTPGGTSEAYNEMMKKAMQNPYEYRHDDGIYYTFIEDDLIVGSQPQNADDVKRLHQDEGVTAILNLQQDKDIAYWGINYDEIQTAARENNVSILRTPARDFDPNSLRDTIPGAVHKLAKLIENRERVYVHCTAGLGRAPGVGIAYLYWFRDMSLDEAYEFLTSKRPCGPKREAIRGATYDLLSDGPKDAFDSLDPSAYANISMEERRMIQKKLGLGGSSWMERLSQFIPKM
mmetsp:Transcript_5776/g.21014  ORF Transcript_5776/g.21014 Transcript_5776/m.21014 type:complete len:348 (-) Transcript_5776:1346-2389(-)